jgi:Holliday junction resolvase RusA-like endonuclease
MNTPITIVVRGLPIAQGSAQARAFTGKDGKVHASVVTGGKGARDPRSPLASWRTAIAQEARAAIGDRPLLEGPIRVRVAFVFPRPKGHYLPANSRRSAPILRDDAPDYHTCKPDADKLLRALFDALTNVVWRDDAQVADERARKLYETPDRHPGAIVAVDEAPVP